MTPTTSPPESASPLSQRARFALGIASVEALATALGLVGEAWDHARERLWRAMAAPPGEWRRAEIPSVLDHVEKLFDPRPEPDPLEAMRSALLILHNLREGLLSHRASSALAPENEQLFALLRRHEAALPDVEYFSRSPVTEQSGWGRSVPPAFFREGIAFEDFETWITDALQSPHIARRREAAHAAIHVGLPSQRIVKLLLDARYSDNDPETRGLSSRALEQLTDEVRTIAAHIPARVERMPSHIPDFRLWWANARPPWQVSRADADTISRDLALTDEQTKRRALERCGPLLASSPTMLERVLQLARHDWVREVRMSAAMALTDAPWSDAVLEALLVLLDDHENIVRAVGAYALGEFGPRAAKATPALLRILRGNEPTILSQPSVYFAVHALARIGEPAVDAVSRQVCTGEPAVSERMLRKLAGYQPFAARILADLDRQLADEPWLRTRVGTARTILATSA